MHINSCSIWCFYLCTVEVNLAQSGYSTTEDAGIVTLELTLSQASSEPFEAVLTTIGITATGECIVIAI